MAKSEGQSILPFVLHGIGGGLGGMTGALCTCPLEVVKTRLQAKKHKQRLQRGFRFGIGTASAIREIVREEGTVRALWKGIGPQLFGVIPARTIHFCVYNKLKHWLTTEVGWDPEFSGVHFTSALIAGATVVTCTSPIWVIKTRLQLQSSDMRPDQRYKNAIDALKTIYQKEGFKTLFKGIGASYLGLSETVIQFTLYEKFKAEFQKARGKAPNEKMHPVQYIALASCAKIFASMATYPHEVIRTRLRERGSKYKGVISGLKQIYAEEGARGLYGGMGAHLIRVVPNAAIMFLTYEMVVSYGTPYFPPVQ
mmetsp:Transcript_12492/g.13874  ORF Transcript_12492/g.13874 Transcript_12492/m.13874 type:complete len:310 (-) Transcript_12492:43-972(-)|eukprot:CAMPEP_0168518908 /NCGR_PEP_ID=MMETSP0405-20121227/7000_1 /TAXON_ID=498012 /ORGANISM="Trichosphaerium sp, Strain Am-I-7 wt" /LENGTH=309 /DNA_ID=CAMNT_0008539345 /DNA_START=50 /DNA_END=979 /DNA_ORIENTATION=-